MSRAPNPRAPVSCVRGILRTCPLPLLTATLTRRLRETRRFIQAVTGPRQVGKTTLVRQVMEAHHLRARFASADEPTLRGRDWIEQQWEAARIEATESGKGVSVLVLDEIQKIPGWSQTVKRLWDEDTHARTAPILPRFSPKWEWMHE